MNRATAPRYDLFKLIVALILVVILVLMLLRGCATGSASLLPTEVESMTEPAQEDISPVPTEASSATTTAEENTPSPEPSGTPTVPATSTPEADFTTPAAEPATETPEAVAAEPSTTDGTPTTTTADSDACRTSVPSRLSVGQEARVTQRLNMRSAADILAPILQINSTNARLEIIDGPVCQQVGESAYLWWQVRVASGAEGWSAEAPLNEATYLLEPIP